MRKCFLFRSTATINAKKKLRQIFSLASVCAFVVPVLFVLYKRWLRLIRSGKDKTLSLLPCLSLGARCECCYTEERIKSSLQGDDYQFPSILFPSLFSLLFSSPFTVSFVFDFTVWYFCLQNANIPWVLNRHRLNAIHWMEVGGKVEKVFRKQWNSRRKKWQRILRYIDKSSMPRDGWGW